jgi:ankyrin repeat protein
LLESTYTYTHTHPHTHPHEKMNQKGDNDNQIEDSTDKFLKAINNPIYIDFIDAIDEDDLIKFRQCLMNGASAFVTQSCGAGMRPLDIACTSRGQHALEMVKILVEEYNVPTNGAAIMSAAMEGNIPIMEYLVQHGANVNYVAEGTGNTALHSAAQGKHIDAYNWLIDHGANVNARLISYDDYDSDEEPYEPTAAELLASAEAQGDVNESKLDRSYFQPLRDKLKRVPASSRPAPTLSPSESLYNETRNAFFRALREDNLEAFRENLNALAQMEDYKIDYSHALCDVCQNNPSQAIEMARILVEEYNASVTYYDGGPLKFATEYSNIQLMEYLIQHGANVNQADEYGRSALHRAAQSGNTDVYHWLVEHGANEQAKHGPFPDERTGEPVETTAAELLEKVLTYRNKKRKRTEERKKE